MNEYRKYMEILLIAQTETSIQISNGAWFDFLNPRALTIDEVAGPLSRLCRFTGQCPTHYSVAQHSVIVSHLVPKEFAKWALLHDAAESVLADVNSPLKQLLRDYKSIESVVETVILEGFGLYGKIPREVKEADFKAFVHEHYNMMSHPSGLYEHVALNMDIPRIIPLNHLDAEELFIERYKELST